MPAIEELRRAGNFLKEESLKKVDHPVATVVSMLADGVTEEEILRAYPDLEREDIREAPQYATEAVRERELPMVKTS